MEPLEYLQKILDEHRSKAYITCDENCFCWPVERMLDEEREAAEQGETCAAHGNPDCQLCWSKRIDKMINEAKLKK